MILQFFYENALSKRNANIFPEIITQELFENDYLKSVRNDAEIPLRENLNSTLPLMVNYPQ